jgi:hypothetical protein
VAGNDKHGVEHARTQLRDFIDRNKETCSPKDSMKRLILILTSLAKHQFYFFTTFHAFAILFIKSTKKHSPLLARVLFEFITKVSHISKVL